MRTNYRLLVVICLVLLGSFFSIAFIQYRQFDDLKRTASIGDDNLMWTYFQLQNEFYRLQFQLLKVQTEDGSPDAMQALQLRYDTFVSRINLALHGSDSREILNGQPIYQQIKHELPKFIAYADTILGPDVDVQYDPVRFKQLELALAHLHPLIQKTILQVNVSFTDFDESRNQTVSNQIVTTTAIASLQFVLIIAFALLAWRQLQRSKKHNLELLRLTEKLEESRFQAEAGNRAKSVFLANMSHEIRTPMNGVIGMISLLEDSTLNSQQADYLATARDSAEHLLGLLNDILDVSKLEAGHVRLDVSACSLSSLLINAHRLVFNAASQKGLEFTLNLQPDLPTWVEVDPIRIRQIVMNLLSNAVKFTEKGFIRMDVRSKAISGGNYRIDIAVTDSGIGIAPDVIPKLFQRFSQAELSTNRFYGGSGLGLEISKSLAKLMKGNITLTSELGKGSCFTFSFITKDAPKQDMPPPNEKCKNMACEQCIPQIRILLVDDSAANRKFISTLLISHGHKVQTAENGCIAIDKVRDEVFDLILMDIQMPLMSGLEAAAVIRKMKNERGEKVVIIALTADAMEDSREMYLAAGMDDYLTKPLKAQGLQAVIAKHFDAREYHCAPHESAEIEKIYSAKQLLVVDDNKVNLMVVKSMLRKMGHEVDTATSGEEACEKVRQKHYDIVFMDLHMPGMGGIETTQIIIRELGSAAPRIIALTADATIGVRNDCLSAGMVDYCTKPLTMSRLNDTINRTLLKDSAIAS
ncbi:hybrid sensor histidine kinase/response regulator [Plesiomonas shigelloides]|uniref:response regulator n=1 Tax=Plesiomonas shigelloides TaxID=703 RepID=UPI000D585F86|nr:response regulator [Plesiomonas shigelloides]PVU65854.1 hybrid sensor histidine kinase/response regulator [Plesiomonas shigelloides]